MLNDYLKEINAALRAGNHDKATKLSKRLTRATGMDALTQLTLIGRAENLAVQGEDE